MKKLVVLLFILLRAAAFSCPVCERQQPKLLRGIVHGTGPESDWDYVIVWSVAVITVITLFFSIKWLIRPGEKNRSHIKYFILNNEKNEC